MPPLLDNKNPSSPSVFRPAALLREARRQKGLPNIDVPPICILDPDGDIVRWLRKEGRSKPFEGWPCYHTQLDAFELAEQTVGIVGCAVGAPFAVLIAEELFESGCRLLLSVTSAGQIVPAGTTPYFVIIDRALRDEGTSYHYAAASEYGEADPALVAMADPIKQLRELKEQDAERIGEEQLNGQKTIVYRLKKTGIVLGLTISKDETAKLWVDHKTSLPVRIAVGDPTDPDKPFIVFEQFTWNGALDPDLFKMEIPKGFTLKDQ
jgi:hypothetical protein